ncbi:hypothetical protein BC830DRAFT_1136525 [Chytriomyces sp. MP71]|nr:hypothetical protein BC830DRAFT_1136525 [Chytriomyces sp. MP71]
MQLSRLPVSLLSILLLAITPALTVEHRDTVNGTTATEPPIAPSPTPSCIPGNKVGAILVTQPNISSYIFVGNKAMVQWQYTPIVTLKPKTVDILVFLESAPTTSKTVIISGLDVSNGASAWVWKVDQLQAGSYKLHIIPDGKETMGKKQNELPCFANGETLPGTSGAFSISQLQKLPNYPDRFPPSTNNASNCRAVWWKFSLLALFAYLLV